MKKKAKKNLRTDYQSVSFKQFVADYKESMFRDMARDGADMIPSFKETWDYIEENMEENDRFINVLIPFMFFYLNLILLEDNKEERKKHIWGIWYYLKLDEPLLICHFQKESEQLILEVEQQIHQILEGDYPEFLEVLEEKKKDNTVIK